MTHIQHTDIAIIGAGPVGIALALWLLRDSPWQITLIDARMPDAPIQDSRTLAISQGSRILLENVSAWPKQATPIQTIHVSQQGTFGRTLIRHSDYGYEALGYVVPYRTLLQTLETTLLERQAKTSAFAWWKGSHVTQVDQISNDHLSLEIAGQHACALHAKMVVHAEGNSYQQPVHAQYQGRKIPSTIQKTQQRDYQQTALISTVTFTAPYPFWAWERFTSEGPLALLPLTESHDCKTFSLVWVGSPETTEQRLNWPNSIFLENLSQAFGKRMGTFQTVEQRQLYPLSLYLAPTQVQGLRVAIGNAAQTLHPVAGQGFNLGLRDAWCLAEALHDQLDTQALTHFKQARLKDRQRTVMITDLLPRIFSTTHQPLKSLLGAALTTLDLVAPLRHQLVKQMMFGYRA